MDWLPVRGKAGDITYLGCDDRYEEPIPDFFDTSITSYSMANLKAFDATHANRMEPFLKKEV